MELLSAAQAISPAIGRTKSLLFRPFQWGTYLKLCAVAVLTEGFSGNFNTSRHGHIQHTPIGAVPALPHFNPAWIAVIVPIALFVLILAIVIFYLVVRLRFALFECLIHQSKLIAPGWHKYRSQAWRFFLLSIVVGFVFAAVIAMALLPFIFGFIRLFHESQLSGQFPLTGFFALFLPLLPVILLIVLACIAVDIILRDFMLPHMALEDASAGQAWAAVRARIAHEVGSFLLYGLLRVVLPLAAIVALFIVLAIPCLIVFGMLGITMAAVHAALSDAALPLMLAGWIVEAIVGFVIFAFALFLTITFGGPLCIAIRNYALVFYGGRYPPLGDILYPPPAAAQAMQLGTA